MRLSVAMCTYQGEAFLDAQLDSVAGQTRLPDELVVHDDGSSDRTVERVTVFAARAPFPVHITVNPARLGVVANFGAAIAACSGDTILLADQDDVWKPAKVERMAAAFAADRRPGLVFSDAALVDPSSTPIVRTCWQAVGLTPAQRAAIGGEWALPTLVDRQRHYGGTVTGATMAFRAEYRELILPMPDWMTEPDAVLIHDAWISLLVGSVAPVTVIEEQLVDYRQHGGQAAGLPPVDRTAPVGMAGSLLAAPRFTGPAPKADELRWTASMLERLQEWDGPGRERAVAALEARVGHLRARVGLPPARLRRVEPVLRELVTGRYRAYSSGFRSAARDLLG